MSKDMSGALFPAREKKSENSPDYTGDVTIGGVKYRLSGWKKQGKAGPFLSLSIREDQQANKPAQRRESLDPHPDDEIPF